MASEAKTVEPTPAAQKKKPRLADSYTLEGWLDICLLAELDSQKKRWMTLISALAAKGIEVKPSDFDGDEGNGTWLRVGDKNEIQLAHGGLYYMAGEADDYHTAEDICKELTKANKN